MAGRGRPKKAAPELIEDNVEVTGGEVKVEEPAPAKKARVAPVAEPVSAATERVDVFRVATDFNVVENGFIVRSYRPGFEYEGVPPKGAILA